MVDDNNEPTSGLTIPSSQPAGNDSISSIPTEPHPEPVVPVASTTDVVKEPATHVAEILGNSSTIVPANSPSQEIPSHKKKNMAGIIVGLILFLGVVATGAYFVARPDSLADYRGKAATPAKNLSGKKLNDYNDCLKDSGRENCNRQFNVSNPVLPKGEEYEPPIDKGTGKCPAGYIVCGSGSNAFCGTDSKTCNEQLKDKGITINTGSVQCNDDGTPKGEYKKGILLNADGTAQNEESIGAIKATETKFIDGRLFMVGDIISVQDQVWEQCAALKNKVDAFNKTSGPENQKKISDLGFGIDKYICKEGVKGEGNIVYRGGACTALNGKKFTGDEKGCFCGVVQVDTGSGHESYTSTCGCDKEEKEERVSVSEPTPTPITTSPICTNIKVYKGTVQVTPSTLLPADAVTIAVVGTGDPTQARFRVNGEQIPGDTDADPNWTISTTKNTSGEYFVSYTIPTGVTSFLFEGETFAQGAWH